MLIPMLQAAALLAFGLFLSLGLNRWFIVIGPKLGLMDQPVGRSVHVKPIPRAGGIAIWLAFMATAHAGTWLLPDQFRGGLAEYLKPFTISSALLVAVGFVDDSRNLRPWMKLAGQCVAALLFFMLSPGGQGNLLGYQIPYVVDAAVFIAWAVLLINAFNLIDGLDGLCGGLSCISLLVIAGLAAANQDYASALLAGIMIAAVAGFMRFNLHPARIFLGDAGSMLLGFFLAASATQSVGRRAIVGSILLPIAIAGVPLLDVLLAIWRRGTRDVLSRWKDGSGKGIFSADKDHLHHRLLARGINQQRVALYMQVLAAIIALLAFVPLMIGTQGLAVTIGGFMILTLFGLRHFAQVELAHTGSLVHLIVKRRNTMQGWRKWYFLYDVFALGLAAFAAIALESNWGTRAFDPHAAGRLIITFVVCQSISLHILRIYRRVWVRAPLGEFALAAAGMLAAGAVAGCLVQFASSDLAWTAIRFIILAVTFSIWLILVPRAIPEILRELAIDSTHRHLTRRQNSGRQILVYGAGDLGNLFISHLKCTTQETLRGFQVSGFLDDNKQLHQRTLNGFRVHGGLDALPALTQQYPLHGILVAVHNMPPARLREIREKTIALGLAFYQWDVEIREISPSQNESIESAPRQTAPADASTTPASSAPDETASKAG
jgi:UDP-GlcNAc:undecaprenyl-phosphate/decaprenyl-phosphate GlcNAc-1-phosphate transferase